MTEILAVLVPVFDKNIARERAREILFLETLPGGLLTTFLGCGGSSPLILPKGLAVRQALLDLRSNEWENDPPPHASIVALIDGTGKIEFQGLKAIVGSLSDGGMDIVFGDRGDGFWGITEERKIVERFENYIIYKYFFKDSTTEKPELMREGQLKDCQAGCWGFKGSLLPEVYPALTAAAYDVEMNLMVLSLERKWKIGFAETKAVNPASPDDAKAILKSMENIWKRMENERNSEQKRLWRYAIFELASLLTEPESGFDMAQNFHKLVWLRTRLGISKAEMKRHLKGYKDLLNKEEKNLLRPYEKLFDEFCRGTGE